MPRDVDERKKRAALRKLRKAAALAEQGLGPPLSDWEIEFLEEVETRIETYGSAFADPEKGGKDEPLSALQKVKLREIDRKARGKGKTGFQNKRSSFKSKSRSTDRRRYVRDINDDLEDISDSPPTRPEAGSKPKLVPVPERDPSQPPQPASAKQVSGDKRAVFRVIEGGKQDMND